LDYAVADRSKGDAPEDRRLLLLARWAGMLDVNRAAEFVHAMRQEARQKTQAEPVGDTMVREGVVSKQELAGLLRISGSVMDASSETDLASLAFEEHGGSKAKITKCRVLQAERQKQRRPVPPLAFLLIEHKVLAEIQVLALLKNQRQRGIGLLAAVRTEIGDRRKRASGPGLKALFQKGSGALWRAMAIPAAACLVIGVALLFAVRSGTALVETETQVRTTCAACGEEYKPKYREVDVPCGKCKRVYKLRIAQCRDCQTRVGSAEAMEPQVRKPGDTEPFRVFCIRCYQLTDVP
jgi:hypothetical protein